MKNSRLEPRSNLSQAQRSACAAVRGNNPAVRGTNPAQGPLMTTKFLEKTFRLGFRSKLFVSAAALQTPSVQVGCKICTRN